MWLINCQTLELEEFLQDVPSYAILSHTWGDEEATFGYDLRAGAGKAGAQKIQAACRTALAAGLRYCWVDTICIDKKSSAELSEAINSMFAWYRGSQVCYVHLVDFTLRDHASGTVTPGTPAPPSFKDAIAKCRWITRGWTLQELIAPANVEFYDRLWQPIGDKSSLRDMLSEITGIENPVLSGAKPCEDVLVGRRMSWAAARTTTRREDMAYCLLGIFGVNMPLIYGEGDRAFLRLQEEIMKQSNDLSILSWKALEPRPRFRGFLAKSPEEFQGCRDLVGTGTGGQQSYANEFTVTNNGLRMSEIVAISFIGDFQALRPPERRYILPLRCKHSQSRAENALVLVQTGSSTFVRDRPDFILDHHSKFTMRSGVASPQYLRSIHVGDPEVLVRYSRRNAIMIRPGNDIKFSMHATSIYPHQNWDVQNRLLLGNGDDEFWGRAGLILTINPQDPHGSPPKQVHFTVLCGKHSKQKLIPQYSSKTLLYPGEPDYFCGLGAAKGGASWLPSREYHKIPDGFPAWWVHNDIVSLPANPPEPHPASWILLPVPGGGSQQVKISVSMNEFNFGDEEDPVLGQVVDITWGIVGSLIA